MIDRVIDRVRIEQRMKRNLPLARRRSGTYRRAGRGCLLGVSMVLAAGMVCAQDLHIDQLGPFVVLNRNGLQLSEMSYNGVFLTEGVLRIQYRAPKSHCSAMIIHAYVDDKPAAASGLVDPGATSDILDLGQQSRGVHALALVAEGVTGGCNVGQLASWGGTVDVWTSGADAGLKAAETALLGSVVFEVEQTGTGPYSNWHGQFIGVDDSIRDYGTTRRPELRTPPVSDDGFYGADWLAGKYGRVPRISGDVPPPQLAHFRKLAETLFQRRSSAIKVPVYGTGVVTTFSIYVFDRNRGAFWRMPLATHVRLVWNERASSEHAYGYPGSGPPEAQEIVAWLTKLCAPELTR